MHSTRDPSWDLHIPPEDIVSWLFYLKQFLSESFSARSVLGKPCSKQVSSTKLIDFYCQNKKTSIL